MRNTEKSGGTRYSEGKSGGWWYAPIYGLRLVAEVWEHGAKKYAPLDWQAGQSFSTLLDCMGRHWLEVVHRGPWAKDGDSGCYHLAHLAWNVLCLLTFMALEKTDLDDVSEWRGVTAGKLPNKQLRMEPPPVPPFPEELKQLTSWLERCRVPKKVVDERMGQIHIEMDNQPGLQKDVPAPEKEEEFEELPDCSASVEYIDPQTGEPLCKTMGGVPVFD
jgi:hypothetical protein